MTLEDKIDKISEEIVNQFHDLVKKEYDKNERCIISKLYTSDFIVLKDIIRTKLNEYYEKRR